jgi:choline dehydrogenase-like flavoprotein
MGGRVPEGAAVSGYAPAYGWEHKEWMRNGAGSRSTLGWNVHFGAIPWSWRVLPDTNGERMELDEPRFTAKIEEAAEIVREWHGKLAMKPLKTDTRGLNQTGASLGYNSCLHRSGSTRAGNSPANSVCTSDFDCHDIENLLFTSSSTIPRTFFWSAGPTAINAAYGWRRMVANHFSTGSSTKGFA